MGSQAQQDVLPAQDSNGGGDTCIVTADPPIACVDNDGHADTIDHAKKLGSIVCLMAKLKQLVC